MSELPSIALSVRQPWAWLIIYGGKDVENRDWFTRVRGRFFVHASKGCTQVEYDSAFDFCRARNLMLPPPLRQLQRGGIVGSVEIHDCVQHSESRWFIGEHGFMLREPQPLQFTPLVGKLGFFRVPEDVRAGIIGGTT